MKTQDMKISSTIVKAVAAAVFLTACSSNLFANDIKNEIADLGKAAIADIRTEVIADAEVQRSNLLTLNDAKSSSIIQANFNKLGEAVTNEITKDFTKTASFNAKVDMYNLVDSARTDDRMVVYAQAESANKTTDTLLPSIKAFAYDIELSFESVLDTVISDRFDIAVISPFRNSNVYRLME